ncbi:uncharacterized protein [Haliotis asinina]|uniref:uncharacterized protein n=1 Tax=Haliotis asinina TaxID=109174 RepID=UPI003532179A
MLSHSAILLTLSVLGRTSFVTADDLQPVPFAYRTVEGSLVNYLCYDGYIHTTGSLTVTLNSTLDEVHLPVCSPDDQQEPVSVIKDQNGTCEEFDTLDLDVHISLGNEKWEVHNLSFTIKSTDADAVIVDILEVRVTVESLPPVTSSLCGQDWIGDLGQLVTISCRGGTARPKGNAITITNDYGMLSDGTPTLCDLQVRGREVIAECGHPPTLYGLRMDSVDYSPNSNTAVYECDVGFYHQSGSGQVYCNQNGTWSHPAIICSNEDNILMDKGVLYVDRDPPTCPHDSVIVEFLNTASYELSSVTISFNDSETSTFKVEVAVIDIMQNSTSSRECAVHESSSAGTAPTPVPSPLTLYCEKRPLGQFLHLQFHNSVPGSLEVRASGRRYTGALECMLTKEGWDYKGQVNITVSGLTCRRWDNVSSHLAIPEENFSAAAPENYCRSPEGSESVTGTVVRPWCYTADSNVTWEYCPVGRCSGGCVEDSFHIQYAGMIDVAASGKSCRSWKLDAVPFKMPSTFPDHGRDHNHCRNPGESMTKPWCYTRLQPLEAEVCNVGKCPISPPAVTTGEVYFNRSSAVIANIAECFFWNTEDTNPWVAQRWSKEMGVDAIFEHFCNDKRPMTFWCNENNLTTTGWTHGYMACDVPRKDLPPSNATRTPASFVTPATSATSTTTIGVSTVPSTPDSTPTTTDTTTTVTSTSSTAVTTPDTAQSTTNTATTLSTTTPPTMPTTMTTTTTTPSMSTTNTTSSTTTPPTMPTTTTTTTTTPSMSTTNTTSSTTTPPTMPTTTTTTTTTPSMSTTNTTSSTTTLPTMTTTMTTNTTTPSVSTTNTATTSSTAATTPVTTTATTPTTTTTTTPTTTFYNPFRLRRVVQKCACRCRDLSLPLDTKQVKEAVLSIKKKLKVETKTLSKSVQKKKSAKDRRPSSTNMGYLAISLMVVVFGAVVIPDVVSLTTAIYNYIKGM